jgi:hypothetical protein
MEDTDYDVDTHQRKIISTLYIPYDGELVTLLSNRTLLPGSGRQLPLRLEIAALATLS